MNDTIERRSISERYIDAASATDLSPGGTDAAMLLAAGFAAAGNASGALALDLWRMRETRDLRGFAQMVQTSANWLIGRPTGRPTGRTRLARRMPRHEATDLASAVLTWWLHNTCPSCEGRQHPLIPGTNRIDSSRECTECKGTGVTPLETLLQQEQRENGRWLVSEYDAKAGYVFKLMAQKLAPMLELKG